jgi:amino acid permease
MALFSTLVLAALPVSRILHLQRAAALAAIMAMICTAVIACVPHVAAKVRASRRNAANRRRFWKR